MATTTPRGFLDSRSWLASSGGRTWLMAALVVVATVTVYWGSFRGVMLFDDVTNIVRNEAITTLPPGSEQPVGLQRRPVGQWSLALNYQLGGLDPWGYHAVNLAIHVVAALFLLGVVRRAMRAGGPAARKSADGVALVVALVWAVHPLQTESVTYVIQRLEALMGLFFLATAYFVLRGARSRRSWPWYLAAIAACWLGMGSKEVMFVAPLVVLMMDRVLLAKTWKQVFRQRGWMYAGLVTSMVWMFVALLPSFHSADNPGAGVGFQAITPWQYLKTQPSVILHYLRLVVWPDQLCLDYWWLVETDTLAIVIPGLLLSVAFAASLVLLWRAPRIGLPLLSFFIILGPTSSFIPIADLAFEHRMYLPLAPVVLLLVLAAWWATQRWIRSPFQRRWTQVALASAVVIALGARTAARQLDYSDRVRMWHSVARQSPKNHRAWYNLAVACGRSDRKDLEVVFYRKTLEVFPWHISAHFNLGNRLFEAGEFAEAEMHYRKALALKSSPDTLLNLGRALERQHKPAAAREMFSAAGSSNAAAVHGLARCYSSEAGQEADRAAQASFERALQLATAAPEIWVSYGNHHARRNRFAEAVDCFDRALQVMPGFPPARGYRQMALIRLAESLASAGHFQQAATAARQAHQAAIHNGDAQRVAELKQRIAQYQSQADETVTPISITSPSLGDQ